MSPFIVPCCFRLLQKTICLTLSRRCFYNYRISCAVTVYGDKQIDQVYSVGSAVRFASSLLLRPFDGFSVHFFREFCGLRRPHTSLASYDDLIQ